MQRVWFAFGFRPVNGYCRFPVGAQSTFELWFVINAISSTSQHSGFALGVQSVTELWFAVGAISSTTSTLVCAPTILLQPRHL